MLKESSGVDASNISTMQCEAIADLISRERDSWSNDVKSELAGKLAGVPWCPGHLSKLLAEVTRSKLCGKMDRRDFQEWHRVIHMYPRSAWDTLQDKNIDMAEKLAVVLKYPMGLGLRLPCARTWHILASLWMYSSSAERFHKHDEKKVMLERFKKEFRRLTRRSGGDQELLAEMTSADEYKKFFPSIYGALYTEPCGPMTCPIEKELMLFDQTWAIRGNTAPVSQALVLHGGAGGHGGADSVLQVIPALLKLINNMSPSSGGKSPDGVDDGGIDLKWCDKGAGKGRGTVQGTFPDLRGKQPLIRSETVGDDESGSLFIIGGQPLRDGLGKPSSHIEEVMSPEGKAPQVEEVVTEQPPIEKAVVVSSQSVVTEQPPIEKAVLVSSPSEQPPIEKADLVASPPPAASGPVLSPQIAAETSLQSAGNPGAQATSVAVRREDDAPSSRSMELYEMLYQRDSETKRGGEATRKRKKNGIGTQT